MVGEFGCFLVISGIQGITLFIDDNCDAEGNYTLLTRQREMSKKANFSMNPVGQFFLSNSTSGILPVSSKLTSFRIVTLHNKAFIATFMTGFCLQNLRLLPNTTIDWVADEQPPDEPKCGYNNDKCIEEPDNTARIVGGVVGGILGCIIFFAGYLLKKFSKMKLKMK